jgi:arylsulfatase A-like enzyme
MRLVLTVLTVLMAPLQGCVRAPDRAPETITANGRGANGSGANGSAAREALTAHVVVVSVDGLRPDAIPLWAPVLQGLVREGAWASNARTIAPGTTLPSHTSMLTGVLPASHGILWNSDRTGSYGPVRVPTVFEVARRHGVRSAAFLSKAKLRHLQQPGALEHSQAPRGGRVMAATETVEDAVRYMALRKPQLVFIHIAEPDVAGHGFGWMNWPYRLAVGRADAAVARIIEGAEAAWGEGAFTLIVTADHGGSGRGHGGPGAEDMMIPWLAWGAGVEHGVVAEPVRTMDTAATVLWLLGIEAPQEWTGRPVTAAFHSPRARAGAAATGDGTDR